MSRKSTERFQLERFVSIDPSLVEVEIKDHERPDFILAKHGCTFGVEVAQLYRPAVTGSFPQREIEALRERIVERARNIYNERRAPIADVAVMFSDAPLASADEDALANELATFVGKAYPVDKPWCIYTDDERAIALPTAIAMLSISKHQAVGAGFWHMAQAGKRAVLDRTLVQEIIDAKNRLAPCYRLNISPVWLLLVMDALYLSSSFTVSEEILGEPYRCAFDRAFLFSLIDRKSWPLTLQPI